METNADNNSPVHLFDTIQRVINNAIQLDEQSLRELAELSGKVIAIEMINTRLILYVLPTLQGIEIQTGYEGEVNVRIKGTPVDLLSMATARDEYKSATQGNMEIIGDINLGQRFQSIVKNLDIDWEELLARRIGDSFAHIICNLARRGRRYIAETRTTIALDVSEYLRFEKEILPDRTIVDELVTAVDEMRNDVERLQQRLHKLEQAFVDGN